MGSLMGLDSTSTLGSETSLVCPLRPPRECADAAKHFRDAPRRTPRCDDHAVRGPGCVINERNISGEHRGVPDCDAAGPQRECRARTQCDAHTTLDATPSREDRGVA
ncbi:hypothetical protein EVAR_78474_1 [Eumeta japonica]|uniref:Uncharacterized protein n=1 Tax=Eumeta variegata TaxID=151549 RepID=A0A4C1TY80_EUMVA|nr:hypothetical protein EVAR_78474_1 [Eumeta japonica]